MNRLILVTETQNGSSEHNFVSTFEELKNNYMGKEDRQTINNFSACINKIAGSVDKWLTFYISHDTSLDFRVCVDQMDLKDFLSGKFNDSAEERNTRLPGIQGHSSWYWENDIERFSPKALAVIRDVCPEQLVSIGLKRTGAKTSLADIIKKASFIQENVSNQQAFMMRSERTEIK